MMELWKQYNVRTTREKIIETANRKSCYGSKGGFVSISGAWCATRTPEQFKEMLEHFFGFKVVECKETANCTALATTRCGLQIAWNGHVRTI